MKKLKQPISLSGERIYFGKRKGSLVTRYIDKKIPVKNNFYLYIDDRYLPEVKNLRINFIYLDEKNEEHIIKENLSSFQNKVNAFDRKIPVLNPKDKKQLKRIEFEYLPVVETSIYVSISDL